MAQPTDSRFNLLIVGAGYAGLAMALAAAQRFAGRLTIGLLDRDPVTISISEKQDPRASALSAGSVNLFANLGLWGALETHAQPVTKIDISDPLGDSPLRQMLLSYDNLVDDAVPATWIIENARIKRALSAAVLANPDIVQLPRGTVARLATSTSRAAVALETGTTYEADLVIAADGAKSKLRNAAGIKTTGWPYDQAAIVTTVTHERPHDATATQHFLPTGPFAILPLTGNRSSIVWTDTPAAVNGALRANPDDFATALSKRFGSRLGKCKPEGPVASWPLHLRLARNLTSTRIALISDAARTVHPIAGQGLNLGLRDVAALADVIAEAVDVGIDPGNADVLARYEQWRRFDTATSALAFDAINRLFSNNNPVLRTARDIGLGIVSRSPALKSFFVHEAAGMNGELASLQRPVEPPTPKLSEIVE